MIYLVRSATCSQGKEQEARQWAIKIAKHLNDKYPEMNVQVLRNIHGPTNQVHWVASYESLAAMEENRVKWSTDPGFQELVAEMQGLFVPPMTDELYGVVE